MFGTSLLFALITIPACDQVPSMGMANPSCHATNLSHAPWILLKALSPSETPHQTEGPQGRRPVSLPHSHPEGRVIP